MESELGSMNRHSSGQSPSSINREKSKLMKELVEESRYQSHEVHMLIGYALVSIGISFWVFGLYSIVISKIFMPYTGHKLLDGIKDDYHYCAAVPAYCLLIWAFVYANWVAMKYFRHN